jgi:hypothetical protein
LQHPSRSFGPQQQIIIVAVARRIIGKRREIIVEDVNAVIGWV